jgi:hypothetical protein
MAEPLIVPNIHAESSRKTMATAKALAALHARCIATRRQPATPSLPPSLLSDRPAPRGVRAQGQNRDDQRHAHLPSPRDVRSSTTNSIA